MLGATGGIGRCLTEQGLDKGHEIVALVRDRKRLD